MGNLTDDMTRLRGEVDALRSARGALMQELARRAGDLATDVAAMRAEFAAAHTAMAKKTGMERQSFVAEVISEVNTLLRAFSRDRDIMARKGRQDRGTFLTEMRRQVSGMCKETADDMMGARLAWRGRQVPRKSLPVQLKAAPLKMEPEEAAPETRPVEEAIEKPVAVPDLELETTGQVTLTQPLPEEEKETVMAPLPPAAEPPEVETASPVFAAPEVKIQKEKSWPEEKPAKKTNKLKRGKK